MKTESDARACETLAGPSRLEKPVLREKTDFLPKTKKERLIAG